MKTINTITATLLALAAAMPAQAHESKRTLEYPGFRPPTEQAIEFAQNVASSKIAVFPSIVRVVNPKENKVVQEHSTEALDRIVKSLGESRLGIAEIVDVPFEIGEAPNGGQFAVFNQTIETIAGQLGSYTGDADYILVLDIIRVRTKAWGIHCYILDRQGENVFSFLLNSHHKPFVDAAIQMKDDTAESDEKLVVECTELALEMLHRQMHMEGTYAIVREDILILIKGGQRHPAGNPGSLDPGRTSCDLHQSKLNAQISLLCRSPAGLQPELRRAQCRQKPAPAGMADHHCGREPVSSNSAYQTNKKEEERGNPQRKKIKMKCNAEVDL